MTTASEVLDVMPRHRVPNGVAAQRLRVALPPRLLSLVKRDADQDMRTLSATVASILQKHYASELNAIAGED